MTAFPSPSAGTGGQDAGLFEFEPPSASFSPPPVDEPRRVNGALVVFIVLVAALVAGVGAFFASRPDQVHAIPGQCLGRQAGRVAVVDCSTPGSFKVVGLVEVATKPSTTMNPCNGRYGVTAYYWEGDLNGSGRVYCLRSQ